MSKNYVIINGELYHGGLGSGRKIDPNSMRQRMLRGLIPNKKKDLPGVIPTGYKPKTYEDSKEKDLPGVIPTGYKPKTYDNPKNNKTSGPSVKKDERFEEVGGEKGKTGPKTDNAKTNNKVDNKTDNKTNDKTSSTTTTSDKKQDDLDLAKGANAAKNTGSELKKAASEINNIKVNRPRMDLSDKTVTELRAEINREEAELRYNELFSQPSKMEKAKAKGVKLMLPVDTRELAIILL